MAEDIRHDDTGNDGLKPARDALIRECEREEENCLYTSTSFFIWLRFLRTLRAALWVGAAIASGVAASHILRGDPEHKVLIAAAALLAVVLPGIGRAMRLDSAIKEYGLAAGMLKNLQGEFRRAAKVWSHKTFSEFEAEARKLFRQINEARKPSLTPPDFLFRLSQRKIRKGHYTHDADEQHRPG